MAGGRKQTTEPQKLKFPKFNYHGKPSGRGKVSENQKAATAPKAPEKSEAAPAKKRATYTHTPSAKAAPAKGYGKSKAGPSGAQARTEQRAERMANRKKAAPAPGGTASSSSRPKPSGRPPLKAGQKAPAPKRAMPQDSEEAKAKISGSKSANKMANAKFNAAKERGKKMQKRSAAGRKAFGIGV